MPLIASTAAALSGRVWWPVFPLLLLLVIVALSSALVWAMRRRASRADRVIQSLILLSYLLTATVAMASESGVLSRNVHRVPSLMTQGLLLAQVLRTWNRSEVHALWVFNVVAWGGILADTAFHYLVQAGH